MVAKKKNCKRTYGTNYGTIGVCVCIRVVGRFGVSTYSFGWPDTFRAEKIRQSVEMQ